MFERLSFLSVYAALLGVFFVSAGLSFQCVFGSFGPLALQILMSPISPYCLTFYEKRTSPLFEIGHHLNLFFFVPRNLSFWIWWILGLWHFHWNLSYSVRIHADMFQYRIFCYFFNFFYLNLFEADMFLPMSHVTYDAITA